MGEGPPSLAGVGVGRDDAGEVEREEEGDEGEPRTAEDEDQAARELNERMAKHREQLKRQLLAV